MKPSPGNFRIVMTTVGSEGQARELAEALVSRRLAACVNVIGPITSVYRWEGRVTRDEERLLVIKSSAERFPDLASAIRELHDYDLPEIVAVPLADGDPGYLGWLSDCLSANGD